MALPSNALPPGAAPAPPPGARKNDPGEDSGDEDGAKSHGNNFTFLVLAGIAAAGLVFFWVFMPETKGRKAASPAPAAQ